MIHGRRFVTGVGGAMALFAVVVVPALAAATLTVSPPSGVPGQVLHAIGSGFSADQQIQLQWDAGFLPETGTSDHSGAFDIPFLIPSAASHGGHVLRACIRGVCSQAVPFTVSVVAGTPPPIESPSPAASAPPSSEASPPASAPPDGASPSTAPSDAGSPAPGASASGAVVVPTVLPTTLPADPSVPGTVKVQFPWDRIAVAGVFALGVLLIVVAAANEKWLKGSGGKAFDRGSRQILTAGPDAPEKGTPAPATPPSDLSDNDQVKADAAKDVKLKGKKLKDN